MDAGPGTGLPLLFSSSWKRRRPTAIRRRACNNLYLPLLPAFWQGLVAGDHFSARKFVCTL